MQMTEDLIRSVVQQVLTQMGGAAPATNGKSPAPPKPSGQFGVYPQHAPVTTQMVPGEIIARKDGRDVFLATGEGLIEVTQ